MRRYLSNYPHPMGFLTLGHFWSSLTACKHSRRRRGDGSMTPQKSTGVVEATTPKKTPHKADYQGASPDQVAEALLRYRPPEQGPKPEKSDRWP